MLYSCAKAMKPKTSKGRRERSEATAISTINMAKLTYLRTTEACLYDTRKKVTKKNK